jgi:transcriptional regulator with XRE-family HTH domain
VSIECVRKLSQVLDDRRRMGQVAERLAELRERRALTLRELGKMSGVAADTINQIELGHRKARPSTLRKLARALKIDVQEFYAEPAIPKAEAPREAGPPQAKHEEFAVALRELLVGLRNTAQPIMEQDDQTIAAYRQALARMKDGIGVSDAYFVEEESPEQAEMAEVADLVLAREQQKRRREAARR